MDSSCQPDDLAQLREQFPGDRHWLTYGGLGAMAGLLLGSIVVLAAAARPRG